jgi:hypothetical protein
VNIPFVDALSWLFQDELDHRSSCLRQRRFKASGLNELKTLNEFDWWFNPKLPKKEFMNWSRPSLSRTGNALY